MNSLISILVLKHKTYPVIYRMLLSLDVKLTVSFFLTPSFVLSSALYNLSLQ